jgi:hypothetical protein
MAATEFSIGSNMMKQARQRGRAAKSDQSEAENVEWWKLRWRDRLRWRRPRPGGAPGDGLRPGREFWQGVAANAAARSAQMFKSASSLSG